MPGNRAPLVHVVRIGHECGVDGQSAEDMRVPADCVMRQSARSFGQKHCEGDEREGLPKFRNFIPDEQSKQSRACRGEETTQSALPRIIAMPRELGGEIEDCAENGQGQQAHGNVSVRWRFEMQVDRGGPAECKDAKQRVLHLQMARFEWTPDGGKSKHDNSERNCSPVLCEQGPSGCGCGDSTEVGMNC